MIPQTENDLLTIESETQPSLTYALDVKNNRIRGKVDERAALEHRVERLKRKVRESGGNDHGIHGKL